MQPVDQVHINKVVIQISKRLAQALKSGEMTSLEAPLVSEYITRNKGALRTHAQLTEFLDQLVRYWPLFEDVLKLEQEHEEVEQVQKELSKIREELNSNNNQVN